MYGVAAGVDLSAGAACIAIARRRRPRVNGLLGLGLAALAVGSMTGLLCPLYDIHEHGSPTSAMDQAMALATISAFLPLAWCIGIAWSHREGDDRLPVAVFHLVVAILFTANRYDALVASGSIDSVLLQPFAFPVFVVGFGVRRRAGRLAGLERSLGGLRLTDRVITVMGTTGETAPAVETALGLIGTSLGASAVAAAVHRPDGREALVEWHAGRRGTRDRAAAVALHRATGQAPGTSRLAPPVFLVEASGANTVVAAPIVADGARWGTLWLVGPMGPKEAEAKRGTIEHVGAAIGRVIRHHHQVAERTTMAAADERNRIARELHDSVTQTLYSVAMVADSLSEVAGRDPAAAHRQAGRIRSMTLDALGDLRVLLVEMRQSTLETTSLGTLLQQLAERPGELVRVELDVDGVPEPPLPVKVTAYRIAHQAVANARRHAAPSEIVVGLHQREGTTTVTVTDDGVGFDVGTVAPGRHGLQIMRERAASVDADLRVDSAPGHGTVVQLSWPAAEFAPTRIAER